MSNAITLQLANAGEFDRRWSIHSFLYSSFQLESILGAFVFFSKIQISHSLPFIGESFQLRNVHLEDIF